MATEIFEEYSRAVTAMKIVEEFGWALRTPDLYAEEYRLVASTLEDLGPAATELAVSQLVNMLRDPDLRPEMRCHTTEALKKMGSTAAALVVSQLIGLRADSNWDALCCRSVLIEIASAVPGFAPWAVPSLVELLQDPVPMVSSNAREALAEIGPKAAEDAVQQLLELLQNSDLDPEARVRAAQALGGVLANMGPATSKYVPLAVPPVIKLLQDPVLAVSFSASEALSKIHHTGQAAGEHTVPQLLELLRNSDLDPEVRSRATMLLTGFLQEMGPAAAGPFGRALGDGDLPPDLWYLAAQVLDNLGVTEYSNISSIMMNALLSTFVQSNVLYERDVPILVVSEIPTEILDASRGFLDKIALMLLSSPFLDSTSRCSAALILAKFGSAAAEHVVELVELLEAPDLDALVRCYTARALGMIAPNTLAGFAEQQLVGLLQSPHLDSKLRIHAGVALLQIGDEAAEHALPQLVELLRNPDLDPELRCRAVWALAEMGPKAAEHTVPQLLELLRNSDLDPEARSRATMLLTGFLQEMGPAAAGPFGRALGDGDLPPDLWYLAALVLDKLGLTRYSNISSIMSTLIHDQRNVETLVDSEIPTEILDASRGFLDKIALMLLSSPFLDSTSRCSAALILAKFGSAAAEHVVELVELLEAPDLDALVRCYTARALGMIAPNLLAGFAEQQLVGLLQSPHLDLELQIHAGAALLKIGDEAAEDVVPQLVELLRNPDLDPEVRCLGVWALAEIGPKAAEDAVQQLLELLRNSDLDPEARVRAAQALGGVLASMGPATSKYVPLAVPPVIKLLQDPVLAVSFSASEALSKIHHTGQAAGEHTVPQLLELLRNSDLDPEVRSRATMLLTGFLQEMGPAAAGPFGRALGDGDLPPDLWYLAALVLNKLGITRSSNIISILIQAERNVETLVDSEIPTEILDASRGFLDRIALMLLSSPFLDSTSRCSAALILAKFGSAAAEHVVELVELLEAPDLDALVRCYTAVALGMIAPNLLAGFAEQQLVGLLQSRHLDLELQIHAGAALLKIGDEAAEDVVPQLLELLRNPDLDPEARSRATMLLTGFLQEMGPAATAQLVGALGDRDLAPGVRHLAAQVLDNKELLVSLEKDRLQQLLPVVISLNRDPDLNGCFNVESNSLYNSVAARMLAGLFAGTDFEEFAMMVMFDVAMSEIQIELLDAAREVLEKISLMLLSDPHLDSKSRCSAALILAKFGSAAAEHVVELVGLLEDPDLDALVRCYTARALGIIAPNLLAGFAEQQLVGLLQSPHLDLELQIHAGAALLKIGDEAAEDVVPQLVELLRNPDTRRTAALALAEIGPKAAEDAVPQLLELLRNSDLDSKSRCTAALILAKFGSAAAEHVVELVELLEAPDLDALVRCFTARALHAMGPAGSKLATRQLVQMLGDPHFDQEAHGCVTGILVEIGAAAIPQLLEMLADPSLDKDSLVRVKSVVKRTICGMDDSAVSALVNSQPSESSFLFRLLAQKKCAAVKAAVQWLKDAPLGVKPIISEHVCKMGPEAAEAMRHVDPDLCVSADMCRAKLSGSGSTPSSERDAQVSTPAEEANEEEVSSGRASV